MKNMKLIYIANARIPTEKAHGIQIMQMCEAFSDNGAEVELIIPQRINPIKENAFDYYKARKNFRITKLPCLDLIILDKYIGRLGLWVENASFSFFVLLYLIFKKYDVIYIRDRLLLPISIFKKNLFFEIHGFPKRFFLYSFFVKRANGVIAITKELKKLLIKRKNGVNKILIASDGVDIKKFDIQCSKAEARKKLNLPQNKKIILYSGHLYKWKGVQVLVDSSEYLDEKHLMVLVGGTEKDIRELRIKNQELKNISIIGYRPYQEIPYWLKSADVLVLPNSGKKEISKNWTSPLKLFEYMASKRPIVASDLPSTREILNEKNAVLIEPDNPEKLFQGIRKILEDDDLAEKISNQAFQDVQQYSWRNRSKHILTFCNSL